MNRVINFARLPLLVLLLSAATATAKPLTRADALAIAEEFATYRWRATEKNLLHGRDATGVEVHTPDRAGGHGNPAAECWQPEQENIGVAYKWGGFDSLQSFHAGVRAGKAAGDVYSAEKRRLGSKAVSSTSVGIDCSGFIARCWKLPRKYGTATLPSISRKLRSPSELQPADIMNQPGGHVLLFARWTDAAKTKALFYEAAPWSKVRAKEYTIADLQSSGFAPLRFRDIRDA
ncbi:hypothetical protein BH20VER1_BH20VER1_16530 [soil metagenome]